MRKLFTSESVTEGHPDKICDQISDGILDELLKQDKMSRVACEVTTTTGIIYIMGEITTNAYVDFQATARNIVNEIGYNNSAYGFDCNTCAVLNSVHEQSPDIALGVDLALEAKKGTLTDKYDIGAGDQGMMFGYACDETPELMPLPISLAHKLAKRLTDVRKNGTLSYLRPDGKTQVTIEYDGNTPVRVDTVVVSTQHDADVELETIRADLIEHVIKPIIDPSLLDDNTKIFVNPTGRFVVGGPM
ncbi:MAG: methionine adenosyltransferase, partial [Clostridia bacterium]|nr:methionine adenosyltransferase [Clostridia bacterium]